MANNQVQLRRDTRTNLVAVIPADGEPAYNTTDDRLHVGNGVLLGGIPHANCYDIQDEYFCYVADSGAANAYVMTLPYAPSAYKAGQAFRVKILNSNSGASTLNINSLGAKNIYKFTSGTLGALVSGDLIAGGIYELVYDGTQFQLQTYASAGITTVKQGNISTSMGSVSTTGATPTTLILAGGEYGFYPQIQRSGGGTSDVFAYLSNISGGSGFSYRTQLTMHSSVGVTVSAQQRYINSSPPFDLGEGDVGGFIFAEIAPSGEIVTSYIADVPPWAYNGKTSIRADKICPITGKKFRIAMKERSLDEIMNGAEMIYEEQEITHALKNADMCDIPHPFSMPKAGHKIVLLDPMDDRIKSLIEYQNSGGANEILSAISSGKIYADSDMISRNGMAKINGVSVHKLKFKYSKK